jgi:hypothetical protein
MIVYKLDNNLKPEKIIQDIQRLINKFLQNNSNQNALLYINIKTISHDDTSLIPKLEYKPCST